MNLKWSFMSFAVFIKYNYKIILWSLVIAYLCFAPSDGFNKVPIAIPHLDKVVHFIMFFILGIFIAAVNYNKSTLFNKIFLPVLAIVYGGVIEIVQWQLLTGRSGDYKDWIADTIGVFIALWLFSYVPLTFKKLLA